MTDINLKNQVFDLKFHPSQHTLYAALLTGEIKAFNFSLDDTDVVSYNETFTLRPTKKSCRGLSLNQAGDELYSVGKDKALHVIDTATGSIISTVENAHDSPINRVSYLTPSCIATGDDEGVIKLWDPRVKPEGPKAQRSYAHHWDYITDFLYYEDKKQLVSTSGDATLSVIDIRSSKNVPMTVSESQDDELLSCVSIKAGSKALTGSSMGILSVWDRSKGWGDCVDRIPGHPHSIETIVPLSDDIVATGSSDGMVRVVSILPSKLMGVIAHHNDFPIERLSLSHDNSILGSASHDECVKLTDIRDIFDSSDEEDEDGSDDVDSDVGEDAEGAPAGGAKDADGDEEMSNAEGSEEDGSEEEKEATPVPEPEPELEPAGRKKKQKSKVQNQEERERAERGSFFGDL